MSVAVRRMTTEEVVQKISNIAELRINIFREFPYSYEGSMDYEVKYLSRYLNANNALFLGAYNEDKQLVGVSTCLPLAEEEDFVQRPFLNAGYDLQQYFYFGESVVLPNYRGQGAGRKFFAEREKFALSFPQIKYTTFCAVEREKNHPLRPPIYRTNEEFWKSLGYEKQTSLVGEFSWTDVGQTEETLKKMIYWTKKWK